MVTKCPDTIRPIDKRVVDSSLSPASFQHLYFSSLRYEHVDIQGKPLLLTGIARPEYLISHLREIEPQTEVLTFPDHHRFTDDDIKTIIQRAEDCDCIVTTEKDMQRLLLTDLKKQCSKPVIPLPVAVTVAPEAGTIDEDVLAYVRESSRKSKVDSRKSKD